MRVSKLHLHEDVPLLVINAVAGVRKTQKYITYICSMSLYVHNQSND